MGPTFRIFPPGQLSSNRSFANALAIWGLGAESSQALALFEATLTARGEARKLQVLLEGYRYADDTTIRKRCYWQIVSWIRSHGPQIEQALAAMRRRYVRHLSMFDDTKSLAERVLPILAAQSFAQVGLQSMDAAVRSQRAPFSYQLSGLGEKDGNGPKGQNESGIGFDPSLQRLDAFLGIGTTERIKLTERRILGVVQGVEIGMDVDQLLRRQLKDLDFDLLRDDRDKMRGMLSRFFREKNVQIIRVYPYFDRIAGMDKRNVLIIVATVKGSEKVCILKLSEEGPRRESLGLRIHNILTDSPIPFMASGHTILQAAVRGVGWDLHPGFFREEDWRRFNFSLGRADEFGRMLRLGDRKGEDLLVLGTRTAQVDFGASFSRHESLRRFARPEYLDDFENGRQEAQRVIRRNYRRHRRFLEALVSQLSNDVVVLMNAENRRGLFLIEENPSVSLQKYLQEIDAK